MKKALTIFIVLFSSLCTFALAEDHGALQPDEQQSDMPMSGMQQDGGQGDRQEMMGGKMGRKGPMHGMHPTVVATSDGGVVVLMGNKLTKFDSALGLVKEVEMKGGPKPMNEKPQQDQQSDQPPTASAPAPGDN